MLSKIFHSLQQLSRLCKNAISPLQISELLQLENKSLMESPFQHINLGRAHAQLLREVEASIEIKTKWQADPNEKWWSKCCQSSRSAKNKCINTNTEAEEQQPHHGAWPVWKSPASSALGLLGKLLFSLKSTDMMKL